jgi:NAD(P)-dependent dehydrogenase (short-subunit alcohol dehydrogenase family)
MHASTERYAKVIEVSKRVRWEIDRDVIRGRRFDYAKTFLPRGLSLVDELPFLSPADKQLLSQVQGRTYACMFGLVERFIAAKVMEIGHAQAFDDQVALEALVRMTDEELKHQELFRRLESMMAADMPAGYTMTPRGSSIVLNASTTSIKGTPAFSVYSATKAAVRSFARNWTLDLKDKGIRVNAVSPGVVPTPGYDLLGLTKEQVQGFVDFQVQGIPLGRVGTPDEIAKAVVFLASDDSSFVNGIELFVDGGMAQI